MSTQFIDHAELQVWFKKAKAEITAPTFAQRSAQLCLDLHARIKPEMMRWQNAQLLLNHAGTPAIIRQQAQLDRLQSSQLLQVLVPAMRYARILRVQRLTGEKIKDPLKLTHFLAGKALGVTRLALERPLKDLEVFKAYPVAAQITALHTSMARHLLRAHQDFFGLTPREISAFFNPLRRVPTEKDLAYESRQSQRNKVLTKIREAGILSADELALIT